MIWAMRIQGQDGLVLRVTDAFLHELLSRVRDPIVKQLDPYRDSILDQSALVRWCNELARVKREIRAEVEHRLVRERSLPRDLALREALLREWVDRDLAADEHFKTLIEVEALVNLVLEAGGVINVFGD